ncbi:MAG: wax ester/triacylglycerol synthase family O-acyltransferase [Pseudomonadota bacterium]
MDHLTGLDATFLHLETPETPLHVGSLAMYELPPEYDGDFVADVNKHIQSRLHLAPIFQRKLVNMPFDLANPVWVKDEHLDIEHHIRHVIVPPPASREQVDRLVSRIHSSLLDRSRPLWEMFVLDGLPAPSDAPEGTKLMGLYSKFHHAGLDGMGGQVLMRAIMDTTPEPRPVKPPKPRLGSLSQRFGVAELASSGVRHNAVQTVKFAKILPGLARAAGRSLRPPDTLTNRQTESGKTSWLAPKTPLNAAITNQRSFARFSIPIAEVKEITRLNKVSLNDAVMAISSEGLMRYLSDMGCHPDRSLMAAVPVSLRPEGNTEMTNQVSVARMSLASTIRDPIERLHAISASSEATKNTMREMKSILPTDFPSLGAPWLFSALANMFARSRLANAMPAFANVVISNVPGPDVSLYFAGAKQISTYPVSIPYHGMALNITLQSYNGWLDFGLVGCRRALPDIVDLGRYMQKAHAKLLEQSRQLASSLDDSVGQNKEVDQEPAPVKRKARPKTRAKAKTRSRPQPKAKAKAKAKAKPKAKAKAKKR